MNAADIIGEHTAQLGGSYCLCGRQPTLGQSAKDWYPNHLLDALRAAGFTVLRPVTAAEEAANNW